MTICFDLDPEYCPDIRYSLQQVIKTAALSENLMQKSWIVEPRTENLKVLPNSCRR